MLDNFQDIAELHKIIVFQTGKTIEEIASDLDYSREHFSKLLNAELSEKVKSGLLGKIKAKYANEISLFVSRYSQVKPSKTGSIAATVDVLQQNLLAVTARNAAVQEVLLEHVADVKKTSYQEVSAAVRIKEREILKKLKEGGNPF